MHAVQNTMSNEQKAYFHSYAFSPPYFGAEHDGNLVARLQKQKLQAAEDGNKGDADTAV